MALGVICVDEVEAVDVLDVVRIVLLLVFLEGILSLDNAAVLGAMVARLPENEPIPWPRSLQAIGRRLSPLLGPQRMAALKVGLLGAYVGRALMLLVATFVIQNPWLRLLGAMYLLYLALSHLAELGHDKDIEEQTHQHVEHYNGFWSVVLGVELADLAFSLDNVVAAVAISDQYWVVLLGVAIGIVTMRFAAGIFTRLIEWEPALQHAAYLLILAIGIEVVADVVFHVHTSEGVQFGITLLILALTIAFARLPFLQPFNVIWTPLLRLCALLYKPLLWTTWPFRYLVGLATNRRSRTTPSRDVQ
jgi:tellurite resistance protein TerC